jgi:hypothetical protein
MVVIQFLVLLLQLVEEVELPEVHQAQVFLEVQVVVVAETHQELEVLAPQIKVIMVEMHLHLYQLVEAVAVAVLAVLVVMELLEMVVMEELEL